MPAAWWDWAIPFACHGAQPDDRLRVLGGMLRQLEDGRSGAGRTRADSPACSPHAMLTRIAAGSAIRRPREGNITNVVRLAPHNIMATRADTLLVAVVARMNGPQHWRRDGNGCSS